MAEAYAAYKLGAHTIGWSTVPECVVAKYLDMRVMALNCITDITPHRGFPGNFPKQDIRKGKKLDSIINAGKVCSNDLNIILKDFIKQL
jgi:purine nucleoside phosphorylase